MIVFADSSAVAKLYADERDHEPIREQEVLVVSELVRVEVPAAIWHKRRLGELGAADASVLVAAFDADYCGSEQDPPRFGVVAATGPVLESAARLAGVHGLAVADAIHLASAKAAAEAVPDCRSFAGFGPALRAAAAAEGFALLPARIEAPEPPAARAGARRHPRWPVRWPLNWPRRPGRSSRRGRR